MLLDTHPRDRNANPNMPFYFGESIVMGPWWEHAAESIVSRKTQGLPAVFGVIDLLLLNDDSTIPNDRYLAQLC